MKHTQKGFGVLAIVLVVALAAAIGGGVYYSSHNAAEKKSADMNGSFESETDVSVDVGMKSGSLRTLVAMGGTMKCTFTSAQGNGTVYLSGADMRGDFMTSGNVESHMIKKGDMAYVWSGSQGAKMDFSNIDGSASAQSGGPNLDESVDYSCSSWISDSATFTVPTTVTFVDIGALMNASGSLNVTIPH